LSVEQRGGAWRVRLRWRGLLALSLPVPDEAAGKELERALKTLREAKRADLLQWLSENTDRLSAAVEALHRLQPAAITTNDLKAPENTASTDALTVRAAGEKWLAWLPRGVSKRGRKFAPQTVAGYRRIWSAWLKWNDVANRPAAEIRAATLIEWRDDLIESEDFTPANANRYTMAVQAWATWLRDPDHGLGMDELPPLRLRQLNEGVRVPRALIPKETEALREAVSPEHWLLVFDLLLGTGLRVQELLGLTAGEVAPGGAALTLREQNGRLFKSAGSARTVPVPVELRRKLDALRKKAAGPSAPVLDEALRSTWGFRQAWDRATAKANITARPHDLRHTRAVRWIVEDGHDLATVRDYLGHSSLATTDRYTRAVADYRLRAGKARTKKGGSR
jgi:integrase